MAKVIWWWLHRISCNSSLLWGDRDKHWHNLHPKQNINQFSRSCRTQARYRQTDSPHYSTLQTDRHTTLQHRVTSSFPFSVDIEVPLMPATRRTTLGKRAFPVATARTWTSLPASARTRSSDVAFRRQVKRLCSQCPMETRHDCSILQL